MIYKKLFSLFIFLSQLLPKKLSLKFVSFIIDKNNKNVLKKLNKSPNKILVLLPKCLQYFSCDKNIIESIDNCLQCGRCKIKDILELSKKYSLDIKVAPGGQIAKMYVEQMKPDIVLAVACESELMLGIKAVNNYDVVAIPNIIVDKPCVNTDVEIKKIEDVIKNLINKYVKSII
jgi:hypothetical protein